MNNIPAKKKTVDKSNHYVDNEKLYQTYVQYNIDRDAAVAAGLPDPPMPEYIATSIVKIAEGLARRPNFCGYTFLEDMIGDAVTNCMEYWRSFDVNRSKNPFAYATQIAFYAFVRRIVKEKKQATIKQMYIGQSEIFRDITTTQRSDTRTYSNVNIARTQNDFAKNRDYRSLDAESKNDEDLDDMMELGLPEEMESGVVTPEQRIAVVKQARRLAKSTSANLEEFCL